jgi:hypothetical protein
MEGNTTAGTQEEPEEQEESGQEVDVFESKELAEIDRRGREAIEAENAPAYRPDLPDSGHPPGIVAIVKDIDLNVSTNEYTCPAVLTLQTTTSETYSLWAWAEALQSQLRRERPQIGDIVAVAYRGRRYSTQRPGVKYHDWRLKVVRDRKKVSVDWNSVTLAGGEGDVFSEPERPAVEERTPPEADDDIPF